MHSQRFALLAPFIFNSVLCFIFTLKQSIWSPSLHACYSWICVLIVVFNYIMACLCMLGLQASDPFHFGTLPRAMVNQEPSFIYAPFVGFTWVNTNMSTLSCTLVTSMITSLFCHLVFQLLSYLVYNFAHRNSRHVGPSLVHNYVQLRWVSFRLRLHSSP